MEGPQGTLYGAGAIGGIIRLTPNPVDLAHLHGAIGFGATATQGAAPGADVNAMVNLPLIDDRVGVRAVGYRERDGGYINDPERGLANINRTDTLGGRVALQVDPGDGWRIDLGALGQRISAADAQYAEGRTAPLAHRAAIDQPYDSNLGLFRAVIRKHWSSGLDLVSATGLVDLTTDDTFDATRLGPFPMPTAYTNEEANRLVMNETRLSRRLPSGLSWVVGFALLHDQDSQSRTIGAPNNPMDIIGVTNVTDSASAFGEVTVPITPRLALTAGGRLTAAQTDGEPSFRPTSDNFVHGRSTRRLDPTLAVSWLVAPRLALFARAQSGYRTGGIAVARGIGRVADFRSDSIQVGEVGLRTERSGALGLSMSAGASYARWRNIQADLFNRRGQPYTDNIGDAAVYGLEATGDWVPVRGLRATFAFLYTYNQVFGPIAQLSQRANRRLPETPPFAGNVGLYYEWADRGSSIFSLGGTARYVGRSVLGTGDLLDRSQGEYATVGLSGGWRIRNLDLSLTIDNLTNGKDNRFALGNPVLVAVRDQTTPLRPRNVRLGATISW